MIEKEIRCAIPEHQVLISFDSDEDAEDFEFWLNKFGFNEFYEYLRNRD